jgi:hypothetical protein
MFLVLQYWSDTWIFWKHVTRRHSVWTKCTVRRSFRTCTQICVMFGHMNTINRLKTVRKALTCTCSCCWPAHSLVKASSMLPDVGQAKKCTPVAPRGVSLTGWLASNWHEYDCSFMSQKYRLCHHLAGHRVKTLGAAGSALVLTRTMFCLFTMPDRGTNIKWVVH